MRIQVDVDQLHPIQHAGDSCVLKGLLLESDTGAAPLRPKIHNDRLPFLAGRLESVSEELRSIIGKRRPHSLGDLGSNDLRRRIKDLGFETQLRDDLVEFLWRRKPRIVTDGYAVGGVIPNDRAKRLGPFQGRSDQIRSPHSRGAGFRLLHSDHTKSHGMRVG